VGLSGGNSGILGSQRDPEGDQERRPGEGRRGGEQVCTIAIFNPATKELLEVARANRFDTDAEDGIVTTQEDEEQEDFRPPVGCYLVHTEGWGVGVGFG
jgi:hypothetical protein